MPEQNWDETETVVFRHYVIDRSEKITGSRIESADFGDQVMAKIWLQAGKAEADGEPYVAADYLDVDQIRNLRARSRSDSDLDVHLQRIRDRGAVRRATSAVRAAMTDPRIKGNPKALTSALTDAAALASGGTGGSFAELSEVALRVTEEYLRGTKQETPRVRLPWPTVNDKIGGLAVGRLHLIGAVTSGRKTTMAKMITRRAAMDGLRCAYWTLEDAADDFAGRLLAESLGDPHSLSKISRRDRPKLDKIAATRTFATIDKMASTWWKNIVVTDVGAVDVDTICAEVRKLKPRPRVVVVDFLQLIMPSMGSGGQPEHVHYQRSAQKLQAVAKECGICLILVVQLTQDQARRGDPPNLGDIRGGASIAQAAHTVLMGHPHTDNQGNPDSGYTIYIRKCKDGPKSSVKCFALAKRDAVVEPDGRR